jgi:cobalt-zinc-cadmium efflux system outer membrane protein
MKMGHFILLLLLCAGRCVAQPVTLRDLLSAVISGADSTHRSHDAIELAKADLITARLRPNPIFNNQSLQLTDNYYYYPRTTWNNNRNRQIWWQLTKPFLWPGVRNNRIGLAQTRIRIKEDLFETEQIDLLTTTASKWLETWLAVQEESGWIDMRQTIDSILSVNPKGKGELRSELSYLQIGLSHLAARQRTGTKFRELQSGSGIKNISKIDSTGLSAAFALLWSACNSESITPTYELNKLRLEEAGANLKLQRSLAFPTPELGFIFNPQNVIPYYGFFGTVHIPLFSRNQGEIRKAMIQRQTEQEILFSLQQEMSLSASALRTECSDKKLEAEKYTVMQKQAEDLFRMVINEFQRGSASSAELIDAGKTVIEARRLAMLMRVDYYESLLDLAKYLRVTGALLNVR